MAIFTTSVRLTFLLCLTALLLPLPIHSQTTSPNACNTNQNPYCAGNSQFEQLCCTYPSICYWSDRSGTPACCPSGTDCSSDGGPVGPFQLSNGPGTRQQTTIQTTYLVQTVYTTTQPQYSTVTYYLTTTTSSTWQSWQQGGSTITTTVVPEPVVTSLSTVVTPDVVTVTGTNGLVAAATTNSGVFVTVQAVGSGTSKSIAEDGSLIRVFGGLSLVFGVVLWL